MNSDEKPQHTPRVDFHILPRGYENHIFYLARLVDKIYAENYSIFILTSSPTESQQVDDFLWTFDAASFLPHHIVDKDKGPAPILISHHLSSVNQQVLINLASTVPDFYDQFIKIIEIVPGSEEVRRLSRVKYKQYQTRGCHVETCSIAL